MDTYTISWTETTYCWATVDADSPEEAIEKAKRGDHNNDTDSDPGSINMKSYRCEGKGVNPEDGRAAWKARVWRSIKKKKEE
jgi:hypothetical protein